MKLKPKLKLPTLKSSFLLVSFSFISHQEYKKKIFLNSLTAYKYNIYIIRLILFVCM